jgi:hypothetical protein
MCERNQSQIHYGNAAILPVLDKPSMLYRYSTVVSTGGLSYSGESYVLCVFKAIGRGSRNLATAIPSWEV